MGKKYLVIISCSMTKRNYEEPRIAGEVYAGPMFGALKNRGVPNEIVDVYIVSAKYGLLNWYDEIEWYDQRMSPVRALVLRDSVEKGIKELLDNGKYTEACVNLGQDYMLAVGSAFINSPIPVKFAAGGIGQRIGWVCDWLDERL